MIFEKQGKLSEMAKRLFEEERALTRLDGWFYAKEIEYQNRDMFQEQPLAVQRAMILREIIKNIPLSISENAIFAGTQRDAFAQTYALINPEFKVEEFSGYCDPTAVFDDIKPNDEITIERIERIREFYQSTPYVRDLSKAYDEVRNYTNEVIFFFEQVTGHVIPDFKYVLKYGVDHLKERCNADGEEFEAMKISLSCLEILCKRYISIAAEQRKTANDERKKQLDRMINTLEKISHNGAENLFEALQLYMLLWQIMCMEQSPNPYAFSVGNADRIFEPYRGNLNRSEAAELFKQFLVFFNVGSRSWAISQNVLLGGRDIDGRDLTNEMTYAILDAYFDMQLPQPILSVKLHKNTPEKLYREMGRFFFTPGMLTPSMFNDDSIFEILLNNGVDKNDIADYSVAGCQEMLIMGKDNGNTTNSWLNLPKVLEMVLTGGISLVTGEKLIDIPEAELSDVRRAFYSAADKIGDTMAKAANGASKALSNLPVPFLSAFMGGIESGIDMRDVHLQGTKYNGSGCLVHGLSVVADSFMAIDEYIKKGGTKEALIDALKNNFKEHEDLKNFLLSCPKFGNNIESVDCETVEIAKRISAMIKSKKNYLGNSFRPDFSSPSTHLLYGYWVGATPDGREKREMLGYGVDPLYGESTNGMGFRTLSNMKLPFECFYGGYASHFGIDPKYFSSDTFEGKGIEFRDKIMNPLFFNEMNKNISPFYLYVNVTTPEILRKVLAEPEKYAPSGVYIMRIHGTFVNFLDLSPAIQQDIIKRLDPTSTAMVC